MKTLKSIIQDSKKCSIIRVTFHCRLKKDSLVNTIQSSLVICSVSLTLSLEIGHYISELIINVISSPYSLHRKLNFKLVSMFTISWLTWNIPYQ